MEPGCRRRRVPTYEYPIVHNTLRPTGCRFVTSRHPYPRPRLSMPPCLHASTDALGSASTTSFQPKKGPPSGGPRSASPSIYRTATPFMPAPIGALPLGSPSPACTKAPLTSPIDAPPRAERIVGKAGHGTPGRRFQGLVSSLSNALLICAAVHQCSLPMAPSVAHNASPKALL